MKCCMKTHQILHLRAYLLTYYICKYFLFGKIICKYSIFLFKYWHTPMCRFLLMERNQIKGILQKKLLHHIIYAIIRSSEFFKKSRNLSLSLSPFCYCSAFECCCCCSRQRRQCAKLSSCTTEIRTAAKYSPEFDRVLSWTSRSFSSEKTYLLHKSSLADFSSSSLLKQLSSRRSFSFMFFVRKGV